MRKTYPVSFDAELRGVEPAREFTSRETGELVQLAPTLQLEVSNDDGSVELHNVRMSDKLTQKPAERELVRGSRFRISGDAVISDEGRSWFSYLAVESLAA